jgi:hypothetical protein
MQRAAVLIGVSRSGTLPVLPAVIPSVKAMEGWALQQGMQRELVKTLTDEAGPLVPGAIKTAIRELVDMAVVEQLIVYFAGHGVNIRYGEYWLLSDAPNDTQAAVNVSGSVELARFCGIPHVIFFSDACRTAPEGIQAQYITGSEIFPNNGPGGLENSVDLFFACTLGRPAYEIQDPASSASALGQSTPKPWSPPLRAGVSRSSFRRSRTACPSSIVRTGVGSLKSTFAGKSSKN